MKLIDYFKELFGEKLDEEVGAGEIKDSTKDKNSKDSEDDSESEGNKNKPDRNGGLTVQEAMNKASISDNNSNNLNDKKGDDEVTDMLKIPKYDKESGLFDIESTDNEELKNLLREVNENIISKGNNIKIESAINEKLGGLKIRKGITSDAIKSLLKRDGISVDKKGNVIGVDDAFKNLQTEQSGLFVQRNTGESTPMLEGYNPSFDNGSTLESSLSLLSESLK